MIDWALVLAGAFGAGLIDAMVGGGGLIQLPTLLATQPGTAPAYLLGTSKFAGATRVRCGFPGGWFCRAALSLP